MNGHESIPWCIKRFETKTQKVLNNNTFVNGKEKNWLKPGSFDLPLSFHSIPIRVKLFYWLILYCYYIKVKKNSKIFEFSCKISIMVSFTYSIIKKKSMCVFPCRATFPMKLIYAIAFESTSNACFLQKSIAIISYYFLKTIIL